MPLLFICGHILNKWYQEAKLIADDIIQADENNTSNLQVESKSLLEYQWLDYLSSQKRALGGKAHEHDSTQPLIIHSTYGYIGGLEEFILWAVRNVPGYKDPREDPEYSSVEEELQTLADREFAGYIARSSESGAQFVYMDFTSEALEVAASGVRANPGGAPSRPGTSAGSLTAASSRPATQGGHGTRRGSVDTSGAIGDFGPHRIIIELFNQKCPKSSENFKKLCTGESGSVVNKETGASFPLHYASSTIHRIVRDGWIQGGDIVEGKGNAGHSAFPDQPTFADENLSIPVDSAGLVCLANNGPHTNSSQFFITLRELPTFTGKYVVIGRVIFGMSTLEMINALPLKSSGRPSDALKIVTSDVFTASMLDENVNKWTRKRQVGNTKKSAKKKVTTTTSSSTVDTPRLPHKKVTLLIVGFESSGKSTIVNNILNKPFEPTDPTVGFNQYKTSVSWDGSSSTSTVASSSAACVYDLSLWSLGGARNIRGYWMNYLDAIHGLVFVVDASISDAKVWDEMKTEFAQLLQHPMVQQKPVLVYVNKQDLPNALSMTEVSMRLAADTLSATSPHIQFVKCCARLDIMKNGGVKVPHVKEPAMSPASAALASPGAESVPEMKLGESASASSSSATAANFGASSDVDADIPRGLHWLLGRIGDVYSSLHERVLSDIQEQKRKAKEEMEKSRQRIAEKKEREAKEAEDQDASSKVIAAQ